MKKRICITLMAALVGCGSIRAQAIISYVASIPQSATDWTKTLAVQGFDSSLGTLTQVQLIYNEQLSLSIFAENLSGANSAFNLTANAALSLSAAGGNASFYSLSTMLHQAGTVGAFDGSIDYAGASGVSFQNGANLTGNLIDPDLARYLTKGFVDFLATATGTSTLTGSGNMAMGASTLATASLAVKYTYTPIPEPAFYAALLGLIAFGLVLRQRFLARPLSGAPANS